MSNMTIKVDFLAGTDLRDAVFEAKMQAINLNVAYINFNFNGTSFSIGSTADIDYVVAQYRQRGECIKYGVISA